jgi:hypothetical protein
VTLAAKPASTRSTDDEERRRTYLAFALLVCRPLRCGDLGVTSTVIAAARASQGAHTRQERRYSTAMPLSLKQRHRLLTADRTHDAGWIAAVVENLLAADPTVTLAEVEDAFRDRFAQSCLIAGPGKTFQVVTGGIPAWRTRSMRPA